MTTQLFGIIAILVMGLPIILLSIMGTAEVYFRIRKHYGHEETGNVTLPELLDRAAAQSTTSTSNQ